MRISVQAWLDRSSNWVMPSRSSLRMLATRWWIMGSVITTASSAPIDRIVAAPAAMDVDMML